ncbi:MAG: DUF692 family protein [Anaerolineaceae bacterium]|nr:DUF692 family protein [Anaerolineaceae bacterium]
MQVALNYSPQAAALLDQGVIELDYYKCPNWPDMVATASQQRPAYVHWPLMAGRHNGGQVGWENVTSLLNSTPTPYVNTHLAPHIGDFKDMPLDTMLPEHDRLLTEAILEDVNDMGARYGMERVILENATWDPSYYIPRPVLEAERISQVVHDTGAGFLLDISHARCSAAYLGVDPQEYIANLPVDHLRELHVTGVIYDTSQNRLNDHFPMTETDWFLTEWVLEKIHSGDWPIPWVVALEYGGVGAGFSERSKVEVIAADLPRLYRLVKPVHA